MITGCIQNNRKAQEKLYKEYYAFMYSICFQYTKSEEDAIEVLQNGFLKVFQKISTYSDTKGLLYTWIRTIMVHTAIDFNRQRATRNNYVDVELLSVPAPHVGPLQRMSALELLSLLEKLPPASQAVFKLFVIDGYSHREIGKILNISEGTSKSNLSQARKTLKDLLTGTAFVRFVNEF